MKRGHQNKIKKTDTLSGPVVVIGNGMVGHRFCRSFRALDVETPVIVLGKEPEPAYDRVNLTRLVTEPRHEALYLDDRIGNFLPGKEADFVVLDPAGASMTARRTAAATTVEEALFALLTLGDDRNVAATFVRGMAA